MLELGLFFFAVYLLLTGLFMPLTHRWLWSSYGLSFSGLIFCSLNQKNLLVLDLTYGLNLNFFFLVSFLGLISFIFLQQFSTLGRDFFLVGLLYAFFQSLTLLFQESFSSVYCLATSTLWLGSHLGGTYNYDLRLLIMVVGLACFLGVSHRSFNEYTYDYAVLLILGVLASLLVMTYDSLLLIYLNLEFQALILYVLTTYYRFEETQTEAGLKYLLVGSLLSGFFLLGIFFFYFINGSVLVSELTLNQNQTWLLVNFIFKLGAAPFYFWTPAVYQLMDYPSLIFIGTIPKLSVWFLLFENCSTLVSSSSLLYWSGLLSIIVGGIGGLYQLSLGSLLAYSSVLNGGYLLLLTDQFSSSTVFAVSLTLITYYLVLTLILVTLSFYPAGSITEYVVGGYTGFILYYCFLSLGGLPVLPGFTSKIYLLSFFLERSMVESLIIITFSLFAVVYYLRVVGQFVFSSFISSQFKFHLLYYFFLLIFLNGLGQTFWSLF